MNYKKSIFFLTTIIVIAFTFIASKSYINNDKEFLTYIINPKTKNIKLYWKNDKDEILRSIENLKKYIENKNKKLIFAMNGGMYNLDNSPQGLYIENYKVLSKIDTSNGNGNFYLKPNGIFYLDDKKEAFISESKKFKHNSSIIYATQSGPMLLINGKIHPSFKENSKNTNIRNGVGILPNNNVVFAMSKNEINLYDFAKFFKKLGCKNALYLDGFVSRCFLPEKNWKQLDGNFGVIIGITE